MQNGDRLKGLDNQVTPRWGGAGGFAGLMMEGKPSHSKGRR